MGTLYRIFLKGLLALLPISLTAYVITWIATSMEELFSGPLRSGSLYFPGAGLVLALVFIFMVGLLVNTYVTQRLMKWLEAQVQKMPLIRSIYSPLRDVTRLFANASSEKAASQRVVMVTLENWGVEVMGLVTRDTFDDLPPDAIRPTSIAVFVPFSYGVGGFTIIVPRNRIRETNIPADKAMQLAITGWIKG